MARGLIIIILLATSLFPCRAQESQGKPIPEILVDLEKPHTEADKAKLLLDLALAYVYKPGEYARDLDTAILLTKQVEVINQHLQSKKLQAKAFFVYSNALREGGKTEAGKQYIEKSLALYKTISAPAEMGEAWLELSRYYSIYNSREEIKKKRECLEQALPLYKAVGNKERQAEVLKTLGDLDQYMGNNIPAFKELQEALAIYKSIGYMKLQDVYDLLSATSTRMGDYPSAVKYGLLAVKTAEETLDTTIQLCTIYYRLAAAYTNWAKLEQSLFYQTKAINIALKYHDKRATLIVLVSLCENLSRLQRWEESLEFINRVEVAVKNQVDAYDSVWLNLCYTITYVNAKIYGKASNYVNRLIEGLKNFTEDGIPGRTYKYLTLFFLGTHQYAEADNYANINLRFNIDQYDKRWIAQAYELKSRVDSTKGNFKSALDNYHSFKLITDSMLNEATSFQFAQMQVQYETEKKDNDIKLLKQQEEIQKTKLIQSRTTNSIVIASIIVLFLLLTLLYNRYRIKQRTNKQLETKQQQINEKNIALEHLITDKDNLIADKDVLLKEKDWLVKEIHHRVKNNLQMVISLLNAQSEFLNNPSALDAIRESRERMQAIAIIHQKLYQVGNSIQINMRSYVNELVDNIKNSLPETGRIYFQVDIADIGFDISQSVPLGLIMNEAITNAVKYAYAQNEKGSIHISLQSADAEQLQLKIADHGKGLPAGIDTDHSNSLGLQLIKLFSEQLEGDLFFINNHGLEIILNFKSAEYTDVFTGKARSVTA